MSKIHDSLTLLFDSAIDKSRVLFRIENMSIPEPNSGCWLWVGAVNKDGYGQLTASRSFPVRTLPAYRCSYVVHKGKYDLPNYVMHTCNNPHCVNPEHLIVGSSSDNAKHMVRSGNHRSMK